MKKFKKGKWGYIGCFIFLLLAGLSIWLIYWLITTILPMAIQLFFAFLK